MSRLLWTQKRNIGPSPRSGHAIAYDEVRGRTVLFGGGTPSTLFGDTWEWDGGNWTQLNDVGPSIRNGHSMAFAGTGVLLFGGEGPGIHNVQGDTWLWDGADWTQLSNEGPVPRTGHAVAFDSSRQRVVLFGGISATEQILNDTWEWNGSDWTQQADSGPSNRSFHALAYDTARSRVVLFGGIASGSASALGDTWEWNGSVWTQIASFGPPGCGGAAMAYKGSGIALFGGVNTLDPSSASAQLFATTWEWDGKHWTLKQDIGPGARRGHAMAYDSKRQHMVLFGGSASPDVTKNLLGDTWEHSEQSDGQQGTTEAPTLESVTIGQVQSGTQTITTIYLTLTGQAPAGGMNVGLTSVPPFLQGPLVVTIPAGTYGYSMGVGYPQGTTGTVTVTATLGNVSKTTTAQLVSQPTATLQSVDIQTSQVGTVFQLVIGVSLTAPAPTGGLTVNLSSVPSMIQDTLVVPEGASTASKSFNFSATPSGTVTVTATLGNDSKSATAQLP